MTLPYTAQDSINAHDQWGANCGPHSLAAATGKDLDTIRKAVEPFPGFMNPTMMSRALTRLGINFKAVKGLKHTNFAWITRIQWEGAWLRNKRESYRHTHYIACRNGMVLCTLIDPCNWISADDWKSQMEIRKSPWHVTHWWINDDTMAYAPA